MVLHRGSANSTKTPKQQVSDELLADGGVQPDETQEVASIPSSPKSSFHSGAQRLLSSLRKITQQPRHKGCSPASAAIDPRGPHAIAPSVPAQRGSSSKRPLPSVEQKGKDVSAPPNAWAGVFDLPDDDEDDHPSASSAPAKPKAKDDNGSGTRDSSRPDTRDSSRPVTRDSSRPITSDSKGAISAISTGISAISTGSTNSLCNGQKRVSQAGLIPNSNFAAFETTLPGTGWLDHQAIAMDKQLQIYWPTPSCSSLNSQLDQPDSSWRLQIKEERAAELADRYTNGMERLLVTQQSWRKKHEIWMEARRQREELAKAKSKPKPSAGSYKRDSMERFTKKQKALKQRQSPRRDGDREYSGWAAVLRPQKIKRAPANKPDLLEWTSVEASKYLRNREFYTSIDFNRAIVSPEKWGTANDKAELPSSKPKPEPTIEEEVVEDPKKNFADLRLNNKLATFGHDDPKFTETEQSAMAAAKVGERQVANQIALLAKKMGLSSSEVKETYLEFNRMDTDGTGSLSRNQFVVGMQAKLKRAGGAPASKALFSKEVLTVDRDGNGSIDFEEFLQWQRNTAFTQDMHVHSAQDAELREFAREFNVTLPEIEEVRKTFDRFDEDRSNQIDKDEFKSVIAQLLGLKDSKDMPSDRFERYWVEAGGGDGNISFDEFVPWYFKYFFVSGEPRSGTTMLRKQYAELGSDRFHKRGSLT